MPRPRRSRRGRRRCVVGVVIDGSLLRGVEVRRRRIGGLRARAVAAIDIPQEAWADGVTADPEVLALALRELWAVGKFSTARIAFGVAGRDAMLHPITVPRAADDVTGYARSQLAAHFSTDLDDAVVDTLPVGTERGEASRPVSVLAVATRTEVVDPVAEAVGRAGLKLVSVDAAASALSTPIEPAGAESSREVVVAVGVNRTTVVVRADGRLCSVRVLAPAPGSARSRPGSDEPIDVDGSRSAEGDAAVVAAQQRRVVEAADAVAVAIHFDPRPDGDTAVPTVLLTGECGRDESLQHAVATASGATVSAVSPPEWWSRRKGIDPDAFDHFVEPAGVAFAWLCNHHDVFDLRPPSVLEARADRRELVMGLALAVVVAAACGFGLWSYRAAVDDARADLAALEADIGDLTVSLDDLAAVGGLEDARAASLNAGADALRDDLWWGRILQEIAEATDDETHLIAVTLTRSGPEGDAEPATVVASFDGVGADQASVGEWLDAMIGIGVFDDVWLVRSSVSDSGDPADSAIVFRAEARLTPRARSPRAVDSASWMVTLGEGSP